MHVVCLYACKKKMTLLRALPPTVPFVISFDSSLLNRTLGSDLCRTCGPALLAWNAWVHTDTVTLLPTDRH
jgi:hypothetical protein